MAKNCVYFLFSLEVSRILEPHSALSAPTNMSSFADGEDKKEPGMGIGSTDDYYKKWDKLAKEAVASVDEEEKDEKKEADAKLGLDTDAPVSKSQEKDLAKRVQLKAAKKQWDGVEVDREKLRVTLEDYTEGSKTLTVKEDLKDRRVVFLKNNKNATFNFPSNLDGHLIIKVFIESCQDCTVNISTNLVTQCVEIAHCTNVTINLLCPIATVQVDLSEGVVLNYSQNVFQPANKIYHSAVRQLTVTRQVAKAGALTTQTTGVLDDYKLGELNNTTKPADENQFVTQLDKQDMLQTDLVLRDAGNHPTTAREVAERKRELLDAMRAKGMDPNSAEGQHMLRAEDPMDVVRAASGSKDKGNGYFKEQNYGQAMVEYSQGIETLESESQGENRPKSVGETKRSTEDTDVRRSLLLSCHSNRAACALKLGQHENALEDASKCVEIDPNHVKGLFRMGLALHALKKYHEACPLLGKAHNLAPTNKQIKNALTFAERKAMMAGRR